MKQENITITNAAVLANLCNLAQDYGFTMYLNEAKPHLYLFYYEGDTARTSGRKPMVFKLRYSVNRHMNLLVKSRYANNAEKLAELFSPSKDNECDYQKYIEGLGVKELRSILAAIGKEKTEEQKAPKKEAPKKGESKKAAPKENA